MIIIAPIIGIVCVGLAIVAARWLIKHYFQADEQQLAKSASDTPTSPLNSDGCTSTTVTESNNQLSQQAFDGVNRNPEANHAEAKPINKEGLMEDDLSKIELPELANESNINLVRVKEQPAAAPKTTNK